MIEWNKECLKELVRKMGLKRFSGQEKSPIHLSLYGSSWSPEPLLTKIMRLDANEWVALGYTETDRVSVTRYLGSLKCLTDQALLAAAMCQQPLVLELAKVLIDAGAFDEDALSKAAIWQQPLTLELAKLLIDAGAFGKEALEYAAIHQQPLTFELAKLLLDAGTFSKYALRSAAACQQPLTLELAKLLISAGCDPAAQNGDGWDALVWLAHGNRLTDPQVADLFLSAGCRTDLDGCTGIFDEHRLRFEQILKEQWKEAQNRLLTENSPTDIFYGPDWGR